MKQWAKQKSGFTLVELLIVIVVIAILAAISVVAYNGVQTRANNTQTADATKQYIKAFAMYAADNGEYPTASGCLGENYPSNRCLAQNSTQACFSLGGATPSVALHAALKPYMDNRLPSPSMQEANCGGTAYVGIYVWFNPASRQPLVVSAFKGDVPCPVMSPNVASTSKVFQENATLCRYTLGGVS